MEKEMSFEKVISSLVELSTFFPISCAANSIGAYNNYLVLNFFLFLKQFIASLNLLWL